MLVIGRHVGEKTYLRLPDGREICLTVIEARYDKARFAIDAPLDVVVYREELRGVGKFAVPAEASKES